MNNIYNHFEKEMNLSIEKYKDNELYEPIKYSLSGGKRIRPMFILLFADYLGLDYTKYIKKALAVEYIHSYSLVHDDLPCMDNDTYRRGKLTTHAKFGEHIGVLVGDGLLTEAFKFVADDNKAILKIVESSGVFGMIRGQVLDMKYLNKKIDMDTIKLIHSKKTAELIKLCFNLVSEDEKWNELALLVGNSYQLFDDINDSKDKEDNSNIANILGFNKANEILSNNLKRIEEILGNDNKLYKFIIKLFKREYGV